LTRPRSFRDEWVSGVFDEHPLLASLVLDVADGRRPRGCIPDIGPQVHGCRAAERFREGLFDVGFEASLTDDPGEPVP